MAAALQRMQESMRLDGVDDQRAERLLFWARSYLKFVDEDEPTKLGRRDLERFLEHLARERFAGRPTQDRVLRAVRELYRSTSGTVPPWLQILLDERRPIRGPNILSRAEVERLLKRLHGVNWLAAALVYGTGIRLAECVRLRVRDIDPQRRRVTVRSNEDRVLRELALPDAVLKPLDERLKHLRQIHIRDVGNGGGLATLPPGEHPAERGRQWGWQYLFPRAIDGPAVQAGTPTHHVDPVLIHRHIEQAANTAGIHRRVTGHVLRNSHAVHMIEQGVPIQRVERLLGIGKDDGPVHTRDDVSETIPLPDPPELRSHGDYKPDPV